MKFECPCCKKQGQIDDSKVPDVGVYANCPDCKTRFLISRPAADFSFEPAQVEVRQTSPTSDSVDPPQPQEKIVLDRNQLYRIAVGKNADYYLPIFNRFEHDSTASVSWNWAAFFGGWIWACYRKMYKAGSVLFVLMLLLTMASKIEYLSLVSGVVGLILMIGFGVYSNKVYFNHIVDKINMANSNYTQLEKSGGVNNLFLYVAYFFIVLFVVGIIASITIKKQSSISSADKLAFHELKNVTTAIEAYNAEHGKYPVTLSEAYYIYQLPSNEFVIDYSLQYDSLTNKYSYTISSYSINGNSTYLTGWDTFNSKFKCYKKLRTEPVEAYKEISCYSTK